MPEPEALTFAFMRMHPEAAAQVLEAMQARECAELFERVPARLGAAVLAAMLPAAAARSLGTVGDAMAIPLLAGMGTQPVVAILRHVAEPRRSRLLAGLPTPIGVAARLLLGYPEDAVGAWADPEVVCLAGTTQVAPALERIRRADAQVDRIHVMGEAQRLIGWVPLIALLRAPQGATLDTVMHPIDAALAANTPLTAASGHSGWRDTSLLPVLEHGGRLLGVLARDALDRALLRSARETRSGEEGGSLTQTLAKGYWEALSGIAEIVLSVLPPVKPVDDSSHER